MTEDAEALAVDRQVRQYRLAQLVAYVRVHPEVLRPGRLGRIDIESGPHAEVPRRAFAGNARAARTGVRRDQGDAVLRGEALSARLDREGFLGTGEPGQIEQRRHFRRVDLPGMHHLRRQKHRKAHRQAGDLRVVLVNALHAAVAGVRG